MNATNARLIRMFTIATVLAVFSLAIFPLNAVAKSTAASISYSHSKLIQLIRDAHTPAQYQAIATYFDSQGTNFRSKAAAAQAEWERRQAAGAGPGRKFPASADSARNLYEYYTAKAEEMARRAADYEQRAR